MEFFRLFSDWDWSGGQIQNRAIFLNQEDEY
jgi:hypothetical protein